MKLLLPHSRIWTIWLVIVYASALAANATTLVVLATGSIFQYRTFDLTLWI